MACLSSIWTDEFRASQRELISATVEESVRASFAAYEARRTAALMKQQEDAEQRQAIENAVANVFAAWTPTKCSTKFPGQAAASAVSTITSAATSASSRVTVGVVPKHCCFDLEPAAMPSTPTSALDISGARSTAVNSLTHDAVSTTGSATAFVRASTSTHVPTVVLVDFTLASVPAATVAHEMDLHSKTPSTCSTLGPNNNTNVEDPGDMSVNSWSAPLSLRSPSACLIVCPCLDREVSHVRPLELFANHVTPNIMQQGQVLRPMPWPSFRYHSEASNPTKPCPAIQGMFAKLPSGQSHEDLDGYDGRSVLHWTSCSDENQSQLLAALEPFWSEIFSVGKTWDCYNQVWFSFLIAGQLIQCTFELNQRKIVWILDWDSYETAGVKFKELLLTSSVVINYCISGTAWYLSFTRFRPTNAYFAEHELQILGGRRSLLINSDDVVYAPVDVVIGSLCCELQSKEILVERASLYLIAEVCLKAMRSFFVAWAKRSSHLAPMQAVNDSQEKWSAKLLEVRNVRHQFEGIIVVQLEPPWPPPLGMCMTLPTGQAVTGCHSCALLVVLLAPVHLQLEKLTLAKFPAMLYVFAYSVTLRHYFSSGNLVLLSTAATQSNVVQYWKESQATCAPDCVISADFLLEFFCAQSNFHPLYLDAWTYWSPTASSVPYHSAPITVGLVFPYGSVSVPWNNAWSSLFEIWRANWSCEFRPYILRSQTAALLIIACGHTTLKGSTEQWNPGIARFFHICIQHCLVSCHLISVAVTKVVWPLYLLQATGSVLAMNSPSLLDYLLQSCDAGHGCFGGSAYFSCEVLTIGNQTLMDNIVDNVDMLSRVQVVQFLNNQSSLKHAIVWSNRTVWSDHSATTAIIWLFHLLELVRSSEQGDTLSECCLSLVLVVLLSEELQWSWDPGGRKFFGFFPQAEVKERRNVAAPAYYRIHCLDHAYYFDKVCADQDYYIIIIQVNYDNNYVTGHGYHGDLSTVGNIQVPWDPGGSTRRRLEVKPKIKEGGMLATFLLSYWAAPGAVRY